MRGLAIVALLLVGALTLSGCSSKGDSSSSTSGSKSGTRNGTNGTHVQTNTTTLAPNVPPIIQLHSTNATGVSANYTFLKGTLTFSAEGSSDPDGDGLSAIAIVAQDSNKTYAPGVLFGGGKFTSVTYTFDHPGVVNVTVSTIDVRGDLTTLQTKVFVDEQFDLQSQSIPLASVGGTPSDATNCVGPGSSNSIPSGSVLDPTSFDARPFNVVKGAKYIIATFTGGDSSGNFAICGPDGKALSADGDSKTPAEASGNPLPTPEKLETYNIGFTVGAPRQQVSVHVVVHYEGKPAK